jgi:glucose-specific phosphotransferase system IIA component
MTAKSSRAFSVLQKIGQSLMMPVSVLPAAGLLVALGRILQDLATKNGEVQSVFIDALGKLMFSGGLAIFEQLPVVFAIGVAIGFSSGAGVAGLASAVGYFTLINVLKVVTEVRGLELAINTGVFGGIIMGLIASTIYTRFHQTKLHPVLGFFSGKRLVPIVTAAAAIGAGLVLGLVWPPIQAGINHFGAWAMDSSFGPALYAAGKRLLIPVGLHHVYYPPFLFEFGEFLTSTGQLVKGESARFFAGDPTAGRFMASEFPIMLFGLPAACLAMVLRAPKDKRKAIGGVMLTAALTSIITGITEPIEFAFIFVAPLLYVFHVLAAFCSGLLTGWFDIHLGYTFSASLIDMAVGYFNQKNSMWLWLVVGPAIAALYFTIFYWAIGAFDFKTPGRGDDSEDDTETNANSSERAVAILAALGGAGNLTALDACITRLRLSVNYPDQVNQAKLKSLGAAGIMSTGKNVQVIFGVESDLIKDEIKSIISGKALAPQMPKAPVGLVKSGNKHLTLKSPLTGTIVPIDQVPDETFAGKILGDGIAISPTEGVLYSPVNGKVVQIFRTNHAIGLQTAEGAELLIHVGLDTVKMNGEGFKALVSQGANVRIGDKLLEFDLELIRSKAKGDITPFVITNMDGVKSMKVLASGSIKASDDLIGLELN